MIDKIVRQAGLEHRGIHSLRHSRASNLVNAEIYPLVISRRLGRASIGETMNRYSHFFDRRKKKVVGDLQRVQQSMKASS